MINNPFETQTSEINEKSDFLFGTLLTLLGAITFAINIILMRIMKTGIHYTINPFYFGLSSILFAPIIQMI